MMMSKKVSWWIVIFVLGQVSMARASCSIDNANPAEAIAFLQKAKSNASTPPECTLTAIRKLAGVRSKEGIAILADYTDFKRPGTMLRVPTIADLYPATDELFSIGMPALPELVRIIRQEQSSELARRNGVYTVMQIFRDDPPKGVAYLLHEAAAERDNGASAKLRQAASSSLRWCSEKFKAQCQSALDAQ